MDYTLQLTTTGQSFSCGAEENILSAALRAGVTLPYGCRSGVCGSCKARLVTGSVDVGTYSPRALSEAERAQGHILLCQARPLSALMIEPRSALPTTDYPVIRAPARVVKIERLAARVIRLYLKLPDHADLRFRAGQYLNIILRDGARRSFSIANPPHETALLELHIGLHDAGVFTPHVFGSLQEKDILRLEAPYGEFYVRDDSTRPIVMVAGGTGFAPLKAMIEDAWIRGMRRPITLYWGARDRAALYLDRVVRGWLADAEDFELRYVPVLAAPSADDQWWGHTGLVTDLVAQQHSDLRDSEVYTAGPPAMVETLRALCLARGLPPERFFSDSFESAPPTGVA